MELKQVFMTPDGKAFESKAEALNHVRRPKIIEALMKITNDQKLSDWLADHQEGVEMAFEVGTIRRVSKVEHNKLQKALEAIKEANNPKFAFVTENASAILDSFRWPSVKRMDAEEKATAARNSLVALSEGNEELATWIVANRDAVLEAFEAGKEKRDTSKQMQALAEYRARVAAQKAAAAAATSAE